ncbi:uncharacterized protein [Rutidosis leptorrhynchoides]|uniref:uncharacterized protein n=1 Tax=Rutidosis leptorrhynchoides TaxID=125765 RepID=UPI003A98DA7D
MLSWEVKTGSYVGLTWVIRRNFTRFLSPTQKMTNVAFYRNYALFATMNDGMTQHMFFTAFCIVIKIGTLLLFLWRLFIAIKVLMEEVCWTSSFIPCNHGFTLLGLILLSSCSAIRLVSKADLVTNSFAIGIYSESLVKEAQKA